MQEGRGEMSHDFDYEFLTNQSITDTSYVDDQGDLNRVVIVPDDQAKIYVPDYKKIISNDITDQLKRKSPNPHGQRVFRFKRTLFAGCAQRRRRSI